MPNATRHPAHPAYWWLGAPSTPTGPLPLTLLRGSTPEDLRDRETALMAAIDGLLTELRTYAEVSLHPRNWDAPHALEAHATLTVEVQELRHQLTQVQTRAAARRAALHHESLTRRARQ